MSAGETLVLMACSATKRDTGGKPVPLFDLYDGPAWQTLRARRGALPWRNVVVLSGRWLLTSAWHHSPTYEERISAAKVDELIAAGLDGLATSPSDKPGAAGCSPRVILSPAGDRPWCRVIAYGAGEYRRAFDWLIGAGKAAGLVAPDAELRSCSGGIGEQRGQLGRHLDALQS